MIGSRTARPKATVSPAPGNADQASALRALAARAARGSAPAEPASATAHAPARLCAPVVAIASGKGGAGKTTVAVNLAVAMRRRRNAILVDADHGTANADVMCGIAPSRRLDLELFRSAGPDLDAVMIETPAGFRLVPGAAGVIHAASLDHGERAAFVRAIGGLGEPGEIVLVDLSAGIGASVIETFAAADLGLVVTTPEPTAMADAYALIKSVVRHRGDPRPLRMGLIVNQAESRAVGRAAHDRLDRVCRRFLGGSLPMLGIVRRDRRAHQAVRSRTPLTVGWPNATASRDLRSLGEMVAAVTPRHGRSPTPGAPIGGLS